MPSDVTLSKAVRSNLLSLQNTADLLNRTQERLATGKKVNSALDNPTNFFTASSLTARSGDLGRLLDSVSNAVQTLQAADKGISSITKLVESAQATARQALQTAQGDVAYNLSINGTVAVAADEAAALTGGVSIQGIEDEADETGDVAFAADAKATVQSAALTAADLSQELDDGESFTITVGDTSFSYKISNAADDAANRTFKTLAGLVAKIDTDFAGLLDADDAGNKLTLTGADESVSFTLAEAGGSVVADLGGTFDADTFDPTNLLTQAAALDGETLTISYGGASASITFGTGAGQIYTLADLDTELNTIKTTLGLAALDVDAGGNIVATGANSDYKNSITFKATSAGVLDALGFGGASDTSYTIAPDNLLSELGLSAGDTLTFRLGEDGATQTVVFGTGTGQVYTKAGLLTAIDAFTDTVSAADTAYDGTNLKVVAANSSDKLYIGGTAREEIFGSAVTPEGTGGNITANTFAPTNDDFALLQGQQFNIQIGNGQTQTFTFGTGTNQIASRAALTEALNELTGITATFTADKLSIASTSQYDITISGNGAAALGVTTKTYEPTATVNSESSARASLQRDFNYTLQQISTLAEDASYNGVNLLSGDNLSVIFNESGSSRLDVEGVDFSATGLGITEAVGDDFQKNASIEDILATIDSALSTLRTQASKFGSNLQIVQTRQDFTKNLINVLETGAANLTLADTNEEAANALALQTRQQLSSTALSLSSQADQAVLRLF